MFQAVSNQLSANLYQCHLLQNEKVLSYGEVLTLLRSDSTFNPFFCHTLRHIPFDAYRWETPALSLSRLDQPFEFIAIASPDLNRPAEQHYFSAYFDSSSDSIVGFENLGGDAYLVVPQPRSADDDYTHLGVFMQQAPETQQRELWKFVAHAIQSRLTKQPLWLNTAGGGVPWLHMRLDQRPKYYRHQPYCQWTEDEI